MSRDYMRELEEVLIAANRKFKTGELSEAAEALNDALGPRGEDIDLELAARVLDGMFYEGFLIVCPKRIIFLHKQPIGGLWYHKSWRFTKIRAVSQDGPGGFGMSVEEDGDYKRLKFFIDIRDYSRLTDFVETLEERTQ
ncbi:MAG: hypothetical protein WAM82_05920 [Thermoanaerobaculia bacterium]